MSKTAERIIFENMGTRMVHLASGRPFFSKDFDISISHKDDIEEVSMILAPYKIGIDVENLFPGIAAELFLGSPMAQDEIGLVREYFSGNDFPLASAVAIAWSIKESFFKCLDYDLTPGKIRISSLSEGGDVKMIMAPEIEDVMATKRLKIFSIETKIRGGYVFSKTIMGPISE